MSQEIHITAADAGLRLDRWLKERGMPYGAAQKAVRTKAIRLNGKRTEAAQKLSIGDIVRLPPYAPEALIAANPSHGALNTWAKMVLYDDDDVVVLNKPSGLATQGGTGQKNSVDDLAQAAFPEAPPRLVHRLDKDTSGVLILAKSRAAAATLAGEFAQHAARKTYWAVVRGTPEPTSGVITDSLHKGTGRDGRERMEIDEDGLSAETAYEVLESTATLSWLALKPREGRTHQLRVHCAALDHPIYGDGKYGEAARGVRLHLHARRLKIQHPTKAKRLDISAPLPPHMSATFTLCGWARDATRAAH